MNMKYLIIENIIIYVFIISYILVILEEFTNIKKSKSTIIASGIIWILIAINYKQINLNEIIKHNLSEYAELFLFLFVTMIYINTIKDRKIFELLKYFFIKNKFTLKQLYWSTGICAFLLSPIADNLTTTLIISSIILSLEKEKKFTNIACINIIIAANAGGSFSPFGDITTLMIWQKNIINFSTFFKLIVPSIISFIIPAIIISTNIKNKQINKNNLSFKPKLKFGATTIIIFFLLTITISICMQSYLKIPATLGMMLGLGFLQIIELISKNKKEKINISTQIKNIEWETLLFFYGIILCIGGLSTIGCLSDISNYIYKELGNNLPYGYQQLPANIIIGLLSAIIDNIPIMFSVLNMKPEMNLGQWLLVTLSTGIGGSILSIGSASGIALMGISKGKYTFFTHLKWSWAILIGYFIGCISHIYINISMFTST